MSTVSAWKVKTGAAARPMVPLDSLRAVVGAPAHWAMADTIARRAVTLIKDGGPLLPLRPDARVTIVTYTAETDPIGGRSFAAEVRGVIPGARIVRISPRTGRAELDSLGAQLRPDDRLVVTTHVRTIEGEGRFAIAPQVAAWIDATARRVPTMVVAHGNPYVIRQFPSVGAYLVTYGMGQALEQASARAVLGTAAISGKAPISLPGVFQRGDGIARPAAP